MRLSTRKNIAVLAVFLLAGPVCFAQNAGTRGALQGEWVVVSINTHIGGMDLSEPPYAGLIRAIWVFNGDRFELSAYSLQEGDLEEGGIIYADGGTFSIGAGAITFLRREGRVETAAYTLEGDTLTIEVDGSGSVIVLRKYEHRP